MNESHITVGESKELEISKNRKGEGRIIVRAGSKKWERMGVPW